MAVIRVSYSRLMDLFDATDFAELLQPRCVVRWLARCVVIVLLLGFWMAREQTTTWLIGQSEDHVDRQIDPVIADMMKSIVTAPVTAVPRGSAQTSGR